MRSRAALLLFVPALLLAVTPALANVYSVRLTNGTVFETRYAPRPAPWDGGVLTFVDETGLEVALPRTLVASVSSQTEMQGFGKQIDTTTVDLGFAPNDVQQVTHAAPAQSVQLAQSVRQFVEPSQTVLSGVPVYGIGGGAGVVTPNPAAPTAGFPVGTAPPFTTGQPTGGTPPPFTTSPTTGVPFGTGQPTGGTPPPFTATPTTTTTTTAGTPGPTGSPQ